MKYPHLTVLIIALQILDSKAATCSKPIRMAVEQWPPYVYTDENNQPAGIDVELTQAIFNEAACQLIIKAELPMKRRQIEFEAGQLDMLVAASITPEREAYSRFTIPYRTESVGLFSLPKNYGRYKDISSFDQILREKIIILAPNAGWYGDEYKNYHQQLHSSQLLYTFEHFSVGLKMLENERGSLIMGDTGAILASERILNLKIQPLPWRIIEDKISLMLSKKSTTEQDVQILNAAIDRLEKKGTLKKIMSKYGL